MRDRTLRLLLAAVAAFAAREQLTPAQAAQAAAECALAFADRDELINLARDNDGGVLTTVSRSILLARRGTSDAFITSGEPAVHAASIPDGAPPGEGATS